MPDNKITVGNIDILSLSDGKLEFDICSFFPSIPDELWTPYRDHLSPEGKVSFNLASFFMRSDGKNILVDTGMGPKTDRNPDAEWGELLDDLRGHSIEPSDIDMVVMTHLHRDHVGWNLTEDGDGYIANFPNARYLMSSMDWKACHDPDLIKERFPNANRCVWPLEGLGLIDFMDGEFAITSELTAIPTPGHTPGHVSIQINSQGEKALILGDVLHNTAQLQELDWSSRADIDPDIARVTRRSVVETMENEDYVVLAGHFPSPGFGKILRLNGARYWQGIEGF